MSRPIGSKTVYFSKVKEAREALKAKALELYEQYDLAIKTALAAGQFEVAMEHMQWLIEHMPKGEEGERMIDESAAKPKQIEKGTGTTSINIGFKLGGIDEAPKALPSVQVVDMLPKDTKND